MSRVALVTGPDPGHALVVLGLARALRARGVDTVVATGTQHEALVRSEGHTFVRLPLLRPTDRDGDFGHLLYRRAGEMAPPLRELLAPLSVDLVVSDTITTVGSFVAELLGVPWVEVSPHHLMDPDPLVAPVGMGLPPATDDERRRRDRLVRAAQERSVREGHAMRDRVRAELGLGAWQPPVLRLLQTLPGLEPPRQQWPPTAHVVGQLAMDPELPPLEPPAGDEPLVVVTDSSASSLPTPLAEMAVAGLRDLGVRVAVTSSRRVSSSWDRCVVGRGPHEPLLDAAAVAVSPGGGGFVAKALTRGVPMVVLPLAGDQLEAAGRIAHVGAGVHLPPSEAGPADLGAAVRQVLDDRSYTAVAQRLAAGARDRGATHAATLVEAALEDRVPVAAGP